jgi:DNA gyrase subunit A
LVGILDVLETEDIMITCKSGVTIRMPVSGISEQGRATQGVKLIRLDEGDDIAAITNLDDSGGEQEVSDIAVDASPDNTESDTTSSPEVPTPTE